jgi:hypothetical protein
VDCIVNPDLLLAQASLPHSRFVNSFAQRIPPFDELAIPEESVRTAFVGSPALNAAAPIEPAAAVTAAALFAAVIRLLVLPAIPTGACPAPVLDYLIGRL